MSTRSHKRFPPGLNQLQVPVSSKAAALAGISLYAPCRPRARLAHRLAWVAVSALGPRVIPGKTSPLRLPVSEQTWRALRQDWQSAIGPFHDVALYHRLQADRPGFLALLLRTGNPVAFLKCRPSGELELDREAAAVAVACGAAPLTFHVPDIIALTSTAGWDTLAFAPLPPQPHRPLPSFPDDSLFEEIARVLGTLPRPLETPSHWIPSHGDCTPWNLRRIDSGVITLVDWECAGWGPPGADKVLYAATAAAVLGVEPPEMDYPEAVALWRSHFSEARKGSRDEGLRRSALAALARLTEG